MADPPVDHPESSSNAAERQAAITIQRNWRGHKARTRHESTKLWVMIMLVGILPQTDARAGPPTTAGKISKRKRRISSTPKLSSTIRTT